MTDGDRRQALAEMREKLELLRRVEEKHGFGVIIEEPRELHPVPGVPAAVTEVFSLFSRLEGTYFCFEQPEEIVSRSAWLDRWNDPRCPLVNSLVIGDDRHDVPLDLRKEGRGGVPIRFDLEDGSIFYCDPDDYVFFYEHPFEEVEVEELAPDIVTFFNASVLGDGYPELVKEFMGEDALTRRDRKGRLRDSWTRLLTESGLL
ncbi:hypothetical protein ACFY4C_19770 [Actinomadura viridis]|uniref:hypothetical protein n=1 Tax=Actinomadura viridis TaxID=58110 RepID=UPI00368AFA9D